MSYLVRGIDASASGDFLPLFTVLMRSRQILFLLLQSCLEIRAHVRTDKSNPAAKDRVHAFDQNARNIFSGNANERRVPHVPTRSFYDS